MAARLAQHMVAMSIQWPAQSSPADSCHLCRQTRLTSLELLCPKKALPPLEVSTRIHGLPADIGQLTALRHLDVTVPADERHTVPAEISRLQALTFAAMRCFESCQHAFCSLPNLNVLDLENPWDGDVAHVDEAIPVHLPMTPLHPPREIASLCSLSVLKLQEIIIGGWRGLSVLSCLPSLRELHLNNCVLAAGPPLGGFSKSLARVTTLSRLSMTSMGDQVDLAALSTLTGLESLSCIMMWLKNVTCSSAWGRLRYLCLHFNLLTCLPVNLSALTALVELDVGGSAADFQLQGSLLDIIKAMPALQVVSMTRYPASHDWTADSLYYLVEAGEACRAIPGFQLEYDVSHRTLNDVLRSLR